MISSSRRRRAAGTTGRTAGLRPSQHQRPQSAGCRWWRGSREVELFGEFGDGQLAGRVVDFVGADGREAEGRGDFVAENCGGGVAGIGVNEHAWDDAVAVEGLTVGEVGGRHAGVGGGVVLAALGVALFGAVFEFAGILVVLALMVEIFIFRIQEC